MKQGEGYIKVPRLPLETIRDLQARAAEGDTDALAEIQAKRRSIGHTLSDYTQRVPGPTPYTRRLWFREDIVADIGEMLDFIAQNVSLELQELVALQAMAAAQAGEGS